MLKKNKARSFAGFDLSNEESFDWSSPKKMAELDRKKVHAAMRLAAALVKVARFKMMDFWLPLRVHNAGAKSSILKGSTAGDTSEKGHLSTLINSDAIKYQDSKIWVVPLRNRLPDDESMTK